MKALVCLQCSTIRSPNTDGSWTHCECGQSAIRWVDPQAGTADMWAVDPFYVRLLGLHNGVLLLPQLRGRTPEYWQQLHEEVCKTADGYLFHTSERNCWAVLTLPGESGDVTFRAEPPMSSSPTITGQT